MLKLNQERGRKMGRIEFRMTENGPELTEHSEEFDYVTYEECTDFLDHLIKKGRILEERKVRGLFNTFNITEKDEALLRRIKTFSSGKEAYVQIVKSISPVNCNHKLMPELRHVYREDLYDFLIEHEIVDAEKLSALISNGEYKEYRRHNPQVLSEDFDQWAKACHFLPSRNVFKRRFPIEYQLYTNRKEYEKVTENIKQVTLWTENQENFRVNREDIDGIRLLDLFDKYSPSNIVIHRVPVEIKHQILQIRIIDKAVEGESGRQYDLYERLSMWNDITSIDIEYEDGSKRELMVRWSFELYDETDGATDFYQRHVPEIVNSMFTGIFTSSYIIDYWKKEEN